MRRNNFVNREAELEVLNKLWNRDGFSLVIIYGRRRIGKTRLLLEFASDKLSVYYVGVEAPYEVICREFSDVVKGSLNLPISGDIVEVLEAISDLINDRVLVILDEFQYLVDADPSFVSRLQRSIDLKLKNSNMMIVLCGSSVSFFERELLGYKSPIFGRREASLKIRALDFTDLKEFFPNYNMEELIKIYGVIGGTPAYIEKVDPQASVEENIRNIITPGSYLYDEALNILRQEVREPRVYFTILMSVAEGRDSPSEVANVARIDPRSIIKYIWLLEDLDIIRRIRPMGFKRPVKIIFKDNYFWFWFTYIYKLRSLVEMGQIDEAMEYINETFSNYISKVFENMLIELTHKLHEKNILKTKPIEVGKWWHKNLEIDVIVREPGKSTTFIEAKWKKLKAKEAEKLLLNLKEKSLKTSLLSPRNYYMLVAREIQNKEEISLGEQEAVLDLIDLEKAIFSPHTRKQR